jgi:cell division protein FtsX
MKVTINKKVTNNEPSTVKSNLQKLQSVKKVTKVTKSEKGQQK